MVQSQSLTQLALFDYTALDTETRIVVQQRVARLHDKDRKFNSLMRQTVETAWEIGEELYGLQQDLDYGLFLPCIRSEFPHWGKSSIYRFIDVYKNFKFPKLGNLEIGLSAAYLLAAPSTPESARFEAIDRAEEGESITHQVAQSIVAEHKNGNGYHATLPTLAEWRETDEAKDLFPFTCDVCGDRFEQPIWHCPGCDHHYHQEDAECGNCHNYTRDGQCIGIATFDDIIGDGIDDVLDPPMEPAQIADITPPRINAGMFTSATPEWYTPQHIIKRVLDVFGEIDLDPCSNSASPDLANVPAGDYFTAAMDGLSQQWHGRVYMNPPYGDEIAAWVDRLVQAYRDNEIDEAIALLPARTDTNWFQPLKNHTLCFVKGRLRFSGSDNSAPFPSVVAYIGPDVDGFKDAFADIGFCMRAV